MSLTESLRPKTKKSASVVLIGTLVVIVAYFVWTDFFLTASIYIALLGPLAVFLLAIFDLMFSSVFTLFGTGTKPAKQSAKTANQKSIASKKSTTEKSSDNDLFDMGPIPA